MNASKRMHHRRRWPWRLAGFGVALSLTAWMTGLDQSVSAAGVLGVSRLTQFGLNNAHDQVVENRANRNFTASWTLHGAAIMDPALINGVLYGGTVNPPYGVVAVNPVNGRTLWFHVFPNQIMNSPIYTRGTIFVGEGNNKYYAPPVNSHPDRRGTGVNQVVALNAETGATDWVYNTQGENMPSFVLYGNGLYVANGADQVLDLAPTTGKVVRWLPIASYVSMSSPTVAGHTAFFGGAFPYNMYAVDLSTLKQLWSTHTPAVAGLDDCSPVANRTDVFIGAVYYFHHQPAAMFVAFNQATGKIVWRRLLGYGTRPTHGALYESGVPLLVHDTIYVGSSVANAVYALNAGNGQVLWSNRLNGRPVSQAPVLAEGHLLVGDARGTLFVLNPTDGHIVNRVQFPGSFMPGVPFVDGRTLFVSTRNGELFALPITDLTRPSFVP